MIPITAEIIGSGIDEEYADALAAIKDIRIALRVHPLTNHTPEGRILMEVKWLEQEIAARRLPIPVDRSYTGTISYLIGSNELKQYAGFQSALERLWKVVRGDGLIKPRHLPLLVSLMDNYISDAEKIGAHLSPLDLALLDDLRKNAAFVQNNMTLPTALPPQRQFAARSSRALDNGIPNGFSRLNMIDASLFEDRRPSLARKPPLAAPVPGLPERAPPLPPELEGALP